MQWYISMILLFITIVRFSRMKCFYWWWKNQEMIWAILLHGKISRYLKTLLHALWDRRGVSVTIQACIHNLCLWSLAQCCISNYFLLGRSLLNMISIQLTPKFPCTFNCKSFIVKINVEFINIESKQHMSVVISSTNRSPSRWYKPCA